MEGCRCRIFAPPPKKKRLFSKVLLRSWYSILSMFRMFRTHFCNLETYSSKLHRFIHRKLKEILKNYLCVSDTKIMYSFRLFGLKSVKSTIWRFWTTISHSSRDFSVRHTQVFFQYLFNFSMYGPMKFVWMSFEITNIFGTCKTYLRLNIMLTTSSKFTIK